MSGSYHEEQRRRMILKLRDLLLELPDFCFEYFRGIEPCLLYTSSGGNDYGCHSLWRWIVYGD